MKRLNWGTGLILAFGLFVVAVLAVVAFAMTRRVDLVTDSYYERGLAYQKQIDRIDRTRREHAMVVVDVVDGGVLLRFPGTSADVIGEVHAYRPDNGDRDFSLPVGLDTAGAMLLPRGMLGEGVWRLRIAWSRRGEEFYHEARVSIQ